MIIKPTHWSAVAVAQWNLAILTPKGIGKRLLDLREGTPLVVEVVLDMLVPPRVRHEGLLIMVDSSRLVIEAEMPNLSSLGRACCLASKALEKLPETPAFAAGVNLRFELDDIAPGILGSALDDRMADCGLITDARAITRKTPFKSGTATFNVIMDKDAKVTLDINFELQNTSVEPLREWLCTPMEEIHEWVRKLFISVLQFTDTDVNSAFGQSVQINASAASKFAGIGSDTGIG